MKIYVKCPNNTSDWFIIELQGEVSVDGEDDSFNMAGLKFGDITEVNGKPVLKIGQHELRGSLVKFDKPIAVLKKIKIDSSSAMDISHDSATDNTTSSTSYEVVGVVRQKFLFKDRPKVLLEPVSR